MGLHINPILDGDYLAQVYGEDANIIHLIFNAFLSDSLPRWVTLKSAIEGRDLEAAASIIHGLKPSFTMAGMTRLRPAVEAFEKEIKAGAETNVLQKFYTDISAQLEKIMPIMETEAIRLGQV